MNEWAVESSKEVTRGLAVVCKGSAASRIEEWSAEWVRCRTSKLQAAQGWPQARTDVRYSSVRWVWPGDGVQAMQCGRMLCCCVTFDVAQCVRVASESRDSKTSSCGMKVSWEKKQVLAAVQL